MSDRYPGGIITKTPVTPAGPYAEGSAPGVWTLEQQAYWTAQGLWPQASNPTPNDPYFQYVTSLLHGDGTNGGQNNTFLDSSTNAFTITRNGNTTQGSFSPYGSNWGVYFSGASSTYIDSPNVIALGSGDFTVEGWMNPSNTTSSVWYDFRGDDTGMASNDPVIQWSSVTSGKITVRMNGTNAITSSSTFAVGNWYHVALVRSSGSCTLYVNGTVQGTYSTSTNFTTAYIRIGAYGADGTSNRFTGYSSNLRAVVGTAVYTSTFTPPTAPLTAISGTIFLVCQSNRFIDNSSNAYTLTISGTPQVTRFSPFAPTISTQYSTSTIGGSGYFDGSGDYLQLNPADTTPFAMGTGDFTIELWFYPTTLSGIQTLYDPRPASSDAIVPNIYMNGGQLFYIVGSSDRITGATLTTGQWYHISVCRSGTSTKMFVNGTQSGSTYSDSNDYVAYSNRPLIFANTYGVTSYNPAGYCGDFRVVKGTALYTTTFTPPTAPLTAVSGTSLLLNYTNAAIYDNSMIPNYETVGNAQISTSVKKYGTGSVSLDGSGDYLKAPSNSDSILGSGNFTIECWVYVNSIDSGNANPIVSKLSSSSTTGWLLGISSGGLWQFSNYSALIIDRGPAVSTGVWYHIAVSRVGSTVKMFVNGTQVSSGTASTNFSDTAPLMVGYSQDFANLNGYVDDLRITKGYARYWENFTPPAAALPNFGGAPQITTQDPQFNYTTMLLPGTGTNGAQNNTFLDSSTNAFTITRNGNTTQGTFTPFSQTGWSNYFGSGNYLDVGSSNTSVSFGTSDFTIEGWFYFNSLASESALMWGKSVGWTLYNYPNGYLQWGTTSPQSPSNLLTSTIPIRVGTWQHIAVTRSSGTVSLWINGTFAGSVANSSNYSASGNLEIGRSHSGESMDGYASNVRVTKSAALYTANFTPSTIPLTTTVSSGTVSVLTCQSNRFIDNSSNAYTITATGSPSVQAFSPFAPTAPYSTSTVGGSGYFDGSDYLGVGSQSALGFGTGDFTLEAWVYVNALSGTQRVWSFGDDNDGIEIRSAGEVYYYDGTETQVGTIKAASWNHIAISRSSGTLSGYVNGTRGMNRSGGGNSSARTVNIGTIGTFTSPTQYLTGYISQVRFTNTSIYSGSTITVPTSPATAVSGTALLLSCTNAGITDATAKNDLETVGNAQISTAQSKFGGSSMYFDGTGDNLFIPSTQNIAFRTGDFTVEGWIYLTTISGYQSMFDTRSPGQGFTIQVTPSGTIEYYDTGAISSTATVSTNTWYHLAVSRFGTSLQIYLNGNLVASGTSSVDMTGTSGYIGRTTDAYYFNGYIDDFRITKGYARYVQPFTPPTQAFQLY